MDDWRIATEELASNSMYQLKRSDKITHEETAQDKD
jgi:hypothetical protein